MSRRTTMRKSTVLVCSLVSCLAATPVAADSWTQVAPLPDPKWELGAVTAGDGRIYAIGGANEFMPQVATVYAYDVAADQWTRLCRCLKFEGTLELRLGWMS